MNFWHYTCDHGRRGIGDVGTLVSTADQLPAETLATLAAWHQTLCNLIWLTDLDVPVRDALGLTSHHIACDRTAHRYRVYGYSPVRYVGMRRDLPKRLRDEVESTVGALPAHWWMAFGPVPVIYDPIPAVAS